MAKSHAAGWASDASTPAQLSEFFCQIQSGRITKRTLQAFLKNGGISQEEVAHIVLGNDMIFPEDVMSARGLSYNNEQLAQLADKLPSVEVLRWCKENNYAVMPSPPHSMNVLEVRALQPTLFFYETGGWYDWRERCPFSYNDKVQFGWIAVRKGIVPGSMNKRWNGQKALLSDEEEVPNVAQLVWFVTTYKLVRGVQFFTDCSARTSSVGHEGTQTFVGDEKIQLYWDDSRASDVGLASCRNL